MRFAAIRTLNKVALSHPAALKVCNLDMEGLITDPNRSIATLAITTLLKTGNESSVDRLMKQIATFMSEISDEFKIVVVESIRFVRQLKFNKSISHRYFIFRALCLKFPKKHVTMMNFLSNVLREEVCTSHSCGIASQYLLHRAALSTRRPLWMLC